MLVNAWNSSFFLTLTLSFTLRAALPELSSIEPLQYDEDSQRFVARGDARLDFDNTRLQADRITYYKEYMLADADGNVIINRGGDRLLAERISYGVNEKIFSIDNLRTGQWPYYIKGFSAGGTTEKNTINEATLYYGKPGPFSFNIHANEARYNRNEFGQTFFVDDASLRIGTVPLFYLPKYRHNLKQTPNMLEIKAGSDDQVGHYLQTTTLFPVGSWIRAGANIDYYSQRGLLIGPVTQYVYHSSNQSIIGALTTGYIDDSGGSSKLKVDNLQRPIKPSRGFAEWRHKQFYGERFSTTASLSYRKDSEVMRDYRHNIFENNQRPDSFFESVYTGSNYLISAFGRFRPNDFQVIQERLPEIRFDLLPIPIFDTNTYHQISASYVQLLEKFENLNPLFITENKSNRLDFNYRVERLFRLNEWLTLTPLAGARLTNYSKQKIGNQKLDNNYSRNIYELGLDLEARAHATYPNVNETWDVYGLRHLVQPTVSYRYFSTSKDLDKVAAIDRQIYELNRPLIDLSDLRNVDQISDTHLIRLGVENKFQTRVKEYGSRNLAALNFYQDILLNKADQEEGNNTNRFNTTWVELILNPAPWLKFDLAGRFKTEDVTLEELRTRSVLRSGEIWEIGLSTDLLNRHIDQYRLDFIHRINERYDLLSDINFDANEGKLSLMRIGIRTRIGSTWELLYALTFRENALRESDFSFNIQMRLAHNN